MPAVASRLLSVSDAMVGSVDMEDTSLMEEEEEARGEPLTTAPPVL